MSAITTHVIDTVRGGPASGLRVLLEHLRQDSTWQKVGSGKTDLDGRLRTLMPPDEPLAAGIYRLTFETREYFDRAGVHAFYPSIAISFEAVAGETHYHVPLLLSPFGYSTYRGS